LLLLLLLLLLSLRPVPPGTFPAGTTLWSAAELLLAAGGLKGLWKGNTVNVSQVSEPGC
jgi:hypothetical protein